MTMGGGPYARRMSFGGLSGPHARDLLLLVGVLFVTFSMQFLPGLAFVPGLMRLSSSIWQQGMIWQLATYPAVGWGGPSIWFLVELLIFYMFAGDLRWALGRQRFWNLLWMSAGAAALVACLVQVLLQSAGGAGTTAFILMQGQRMLIAIVIAAFALIRRDATIMLFFVLPIRAKWFIWIEIAFAWVGLLRYRRPRRFPRYLHGDRRRVRSPAATAREGPDARDAASLRALVREAEAEPRPAPIPRRPGRQ